MAKNKGTLISAPIRPIDSLDQIASAFAYEIKGGLHSVQNITERNLIFTSRREWGMIVSVYNEGSNNGLYTLTKGRVSNNIDDNGNWERLELSGGGGGDGADGTSGSSGTSGVSGTSGSSGSSGMSGTSGTSGTSVSISFQNTDTISFTTTPGEPLVVTAQVNTYSISPEFLDYGLNPTDGEGKILSVDSQGNFYWKDPQSLTYVYAPSFLPVFFSSTTQRFVSTPTSGNFNVGDWQPSSDWTSSITRPTTNQPNIVSFICGSFSLSNLSSTMSYQILDGSGALLSSISNLLIDSNKTENSTGISLQITNLSTDLDKWKASVSGTIDLGILLPSGGRFLVQVSHYDISGIFSFTSSSYFWDSDGITSSVTVDGPLEIEELLQQTVKYSGVTFYTLGTQFRLRARGINLLNDKSFPSDKQVELIPTNLGTTQIVSGSGSNLVGWNTQWNNSGVEFSSTVISNQASFYYPNYQTNNIISGLSNSYFEARVWDWGMVSSTQSSKIKILYDGFVPSSYSGTFNPLDSEANRIKMSSITQSITAFDSEQSLLSQNDELQYIFGRLIYPQSNFTEFLPSSNSTRNYSSLTGSTKNFLVYTDLSLGDTQMVTLSGYRWYVSEYSKGINTFNNGIFTFESNFSESDLHTGLNTTGTQDLAILVGVDSGPTDVYPDKFIFLSDVTNYEGRSDTLIYNLNNSQKKISFTTGTIINPSKIWLLIGYKNTTRGKNLNLSQINFE